MNAKEVGFPLNPVLDIFPGKRHKMRGEDRGLQLLKGVGAEILAVRSDNKSWDEDTRCEAGEHQCGKRLENGAQRR